MTFEEALAELQLLSRKMSEGGLTLEDSVNAYARGVELSKHCQKLLDDARARIQRCDQELQGEYPQDAEPPYFPQGTPDPDRDIPF